MSVFPRRFLCVPVVALLTAVAGCSLTNDDDARPVPTPSGRAAEMCRALAGTSANAYRRLNGCQDTAPVRCPVRLARTCIPVKTISPQAISNKINRFAV